jgi:hypothetical protein
MRFADSMSSKETLSPLFQSLLFVPGFLSLISFVMENVSVPELFAVWPVRRSSRRNACGRWRWLSQNGDRLPVPAASG